VIRYRYNQQVSPPAPFLHLVLARPDGTRSSGEIPAQIDSAADITAVPADVIDDLELVQFGSMDVAAFAGVLKTVRTFLVQLSLRGGNPVVVKVVASSDEPHVLLGRDVLNRHRILLDGPQGMMEID
jgi:hypothetical protein